jgi:hypothetical protein
MGYICYTLFWHFMLQIVCRIMEAIVPRAFPICVSVQVQVRMGYIHFILFLYFMFVKFLNILESAVPRKCSPLNWWGLRVRVIRFPSEQEIVRNKSFPSYSIPSKIFLTWLLWEGIYLLVGQGRYRDPKPSALKILLTPPHQPPRSISRAPLCSLPPN